MPNAEFTAPANVSLIKLNATKGGEYVIALDANLAYLENIPSGPKPNITLLAPFSDNPLNKSAKFGSITSYTSALPFL